MSLDFSIIIPTYNRIELLRCCLHYLEALNYPRSQFEVIVVDDGSSDETAGLEPKGWNLNLRVIHQPNSGTSMARNAGIEAARGTFCMFVDDDVMVHPDLLLEHFRLHTAQPRRLVRGPVINFSALPCPLENKTPEKPGSLPERLWKLWSGCSLSMLRHFSMNYLCTSNASLARIHLQAAGMFDPSFVRWEDADLGVRLKKLGIERCFSLEAVVYHLKPEEPWDRRILTARKDGRSAAELYLRYPGTAMLLRSGIHAANILRNSIFTKGPLRGEIEKAAGGGKSLLFSQSFAQNMLLEEAYLEAGSQRLKRT